ncbi:polysaccharide biosynthesis tyrosine autokinase [Arthrobacter sp. S39]|uniref:polysaccharide biosynthesis tyrosine autokinase n=1 Tax=Arthrobacter sp. S39 TaxID=2509720 RepID=UPI001037DA7A|nr:polysaccharide biosynthesis tyrosine autokinase [Arthrobacter sp. S39]TAP39117.1 polysaccharide biosynthesis tyrosine autokinase [Arthrobacter sp. S39]
MDLRDYMRILRRNWMLLIAITMAGVIVGGAASLAVRPTYTATTQLFVAIQNSGSVQELQQGNTFSQARVQSYVKTVTTPRVLQPVIDSLGLDTTPTALSRRVTASSDVNTVIVTIAVSDTSPVQAAAIAQGIADSLVQAVDSLEKPKNGGISPVGLSVITPAEAPKEPSGPNVRFNLAIGLLLGLALGSAVAILRSLLDNSVRTETDLRRTTDAAILGRVSFDAEAAKKPLITQVAIQSPRAEAFRQIRTNLQFAHIGSKSKTILVTSSLPGEGKTTTATNLAIAMAESGNSVLLIDADLRRPMVSQYLGLERDAGLTTALLGRAEVEELVQPWGDGDLFVLTSGQIPPNPSELLGSATMGALIERLETIFDSIVIDAPPLLPVTDAAVLSQYAGGVVVIVGTHKVKQNDLASALRSLEMVGADLFGLVLNRLPTKGPDAYSESNYTYESFAKSDFEASVRSNHMNSPRMNRRQAEKPLRDPSQFPSAAASSSSLFTQAAETGNSEQMRS